MQDFPGIYEVIVTDECGIESISSSEIYLDDLANAEILNANDFCESGPVVNLIAFDTGGTWTGNGILDTNNGTFDPNLAGPGIHNITYTIEGECGDQDSIELIVNEDVNATIFNVDDFCESDPVVNLNAAEPGGVWTGNGILNSNTGTFDPNLAGPGTHNITYTINGTCEDQDSIELIVSAEVDATIFDIDNLCESDQVTDLNTIDPGGTWNGNGIINTNNGEFDPNIAGPGIHMITYTIDGACSDQDSTEIIVIQEIQSSIIAPPSICKNEPPIILQAIPENGTWQATSGLINSSNLFDPISAQLGINTITYTPDGFCMEVSNHEIDVNEIIVPETELYHEICFGELVNLNTGQTSFLEYNWSSGENLSNINVYNEGTYMVTLTDFNNCIQELKFDVINKNNCEVINMPNVFTPNNDFENDLFIPITYKHIPNSVLKIYNRWGKEVYYTNVIEDGWDGNHLSEECPEGTYLWVVEFPTNNGFKRISGSVNLFR